MALTLLFMTGCVTSNQPYELTAEQIKPYVEFVEQQTGYRLDPPPRVLVNQSELRLAYAETENVFTYIPLAMHYRGTIYLDQTRFSLAAPRSQSFLVHELVHYGQYTALIAAERDGTITGLRARKGWACIRSKEREAYTIQNRWLARYPNERQLSEHDRGCPNGPTAAIY
jgi:hypothetical protein